MNSSRILLIFACIAIAITLLCCGVSRDREFTEYSLFVKHRPTLHFYFRSPLGERSFEDLGESEQKQELLYEEFVDRQKPASASTVNWILPEFLLQLILTLLVAATAAMPVISLKKLLLHLAVNLIPTACAIGVVIYLHSFKVSACAFIAVVIINVWTARKL